MKITILRGVLMSSATRRLLHYSLNVLRNSSKKIYSKYLPSIGGPCQQMTKLESLGSALHMRQWLKHREEPCFISTRLWTTLSPEFISEKLRTGSADIVAEICCFIDKLMCSSMPQQFWNWSNDEWTRRVLQKTPRLLDLEKVEER